MSFISPEFACIALFLYPIYWLLKPYRTAQQLFLLLCSYSLYATWSVQFAIVLFIFSTYIWLCGAWISTLPQNSRRTMWSCLCILGSLSVLFATKYYQFFRDLLVSCFPSLGHAGLLPVFELVAPAGISFFTFQSITYLTWEGRGRLTSSSYLRLLLFLSFWPTLFAGPILRAKDFFAQLEQEDTGYPKEIERAAYYLLLGLTQKLVFANWLATVFVDEGFRYPDSHTVISASATILAYSLQILFDFAGYSLIVTALALLLGFTIPVNFRQPYLAANLGDFWRRWHISLSLFIRDYVYIPLGGNRYGFSRTQCNILIAMLLSGIWHGANTTFLVWGLMHGCGVIAVNIAHSISAYRLPVLVGRGLTLVYVATAWVFFRAGTLESAVSVLGGLTGEIGTVGYPHFMLLYLTATYLILATQAYEFEEAVVSRLSHFSALSIASLTSIIIFFIVLFGPSGVPGFIYFQF